MSIAPELVDADVINQFVEEESAPSHAAVPDYSVDTVQACGAAFLQPLIAEFVYLMNAAERQDTPVEPFFFGPCYRDDDKEKATPLIVVPVNLVQAVHHMFSVEAKNDVGNPVISRDMIKCMLLFLGGTLGLNQAPFFTRCYYGGNDEWYAFTTHRWSELKSMVVTFAGGEQFSRIRSQPLIETINGKVPFAFNVPGEHYTPLNATPTKLFKERLDALREEPDDGRLDRTETGFYVCRIKSDEEQTIVEQWAARHADEPLTREESRQALATVENAPHHAIFETFFVRDHDGTVIVAPRPFVGNAPPTMKFKSKSVRNAKKRRAALTLGGGASGGSDASAAEEAAPVAPPRKRRRRGGS